MKYYSEELKKVFNSPEELEKAESDAKELEVKEEESKKSLALRIDKANDEVEKAYEAYDAAKEEAAKILEESNEKIDTILKNAQKVIEEAESKKTEAIKKFNEKFGVYTTTYTGEKAIKEFNKRMDRLSKDFFHLWF